MDVHTELFNHDGATNNYLSNEHTQIPSLYVIFFVLYLCFLGLWVFTCFKNRRSVLQLHLLMGVLLIMKTLSLLCAAVDKHYVKVTAGTHHGWNVLFYIFEFMNSVLSFTVIMLIGAGWPYLKPFLLEKEKKVLMIVIPLQALANVAFIVIGETGPLANVAFIWNQFLLVDFICCCDVILLVVWSIRSFARTDAKDARNNLKESKVFCAAVIGYLLFTRIGVFAMKIFVVYKDQWVCSAEEELGSIVFYLVMFYIFRPVKDFALDDGGDCEEAAELVKG